MQRAKSLLLTMVLPAPNGCNLKCPSCAIAQRGEALRSELALEDYLRFLTEIASTLPVECLSIQGYEPLLPETWRLTKAVLEKADQFDLETRLVTNGVLLSQRAKELSGLADTIAISLDSSDSAIHEKVRGVKGCFGQTVKGIRAAVKHFSKETVTVSSILFPNRARNLEGMPEFLAELGVGEWEIGIYTDFRKGTCLASNQWLKDTILHFAEEGTKYGIQVALSDELRQFDVEHLYEELTVSALEKDMYVVRLSPDGTCSRGREILLTSASAPWWDRIEPPRQFLSRILAEVGVKFS